MVARATGALSAERTLPGRFVFSDLRPDRSARDRGMDSGGSPPRPFPIADAQVHLDADATRRVTPKAPSSKHQRSSKNQTSKAMRGILLKFGAWDFSGAWCLEFGAL